MHTVEIEKTECRYRPFKVIMRNCHDEVVEVFEANSEWVAKVRYDQWVSMIDEGDYRRGEE